jgi:hypothetical protein
MEGYVCFRTRVDRRTPATGDFLASSTACFFAREVVVVDFFGSVTFEAFAGFRFVVSLSVAGTEESALLGTAGRRVRGRVGFGAAAGLG